LAQINLLPWRDERRQELKKEFLSVVSFVFVVGVALVLLGDRVLNSQIDEQYSRNKYLTEHIATLNKQVAEIRDIQKKRDQLLDRMKVIQELQGNRPFIVRILDQLVRTVPDGVFYTKLIIRDTDIAISGIAASNNRVSSLMRRLDASDWLTDPNLDAVRAAPNYADQTTTFDLTVRVQPYLPTSSADRGEG